MLIQYSTGRPFFHTSSDITNDVSNSSIYVSNNIFFDEHKSRGIVLVNKTHNKLFLLEITGEKLGLCSTCLSLTHSIGRSVTWLDSLLVRWSVHRSVRRSVGHSFEFSPIEWNRLIFVALSRFLFFFDLLYPC